MICNYTSLQILRNFIAHLFYRRYAELVASILTLQSGFDTFGVGGGGDMIFHDLQIIRNEMIGMSILL